MSTGPAHGCILKKGITRSWPPRVDGTSVAHVQAAGCSRQSLSETTCAVMCCAVAVQACLPPSAPSRACSPRHRRRAASAFPQRSTRNSSSARPSGSSGAGKHCHVTTTNTPAWSLHHLAMLLPLPAPAEPTNQALMAVVLAAWVSATPVPSQAPSRVGPSTPFPLQMPQGALTVTCTPPTALHSLTQCLQHPASLLPWTSHQAGAQTRAGAGHPWTWSTLGPMPPTGPPPALLQG